MSTPTGLDVRHLQGLRATTRDLDLLTNRIEAHLDAHEGYLAFSGGKDSLVTLHLALRADPEVPVVFFDSGFEYPETYTYLEHIAEAWRLNLHVTPARRTTLQVLVDSGAWDHTAPTPATREDLHRILITEPAAAAHQTHGPGELWGVRAQESRGRAAAYANALRAARCPCVPPCTPRAARARHGGVITREDATVAFGPVWDWATDEIWGHIARHHLPANPVYAKLRALGAPEHFLRVSHVLDGTRLEEGRVTWLRRGWPEIFEEIAGALPRVSGYV